MLLPECVCTVVFEFLVVMFARSADFVELEMVVVASFVFGCCYHCCCCGCCCCGCCFFVFPSPSSS
jgi:hypothetical protein